MRRAVFLDTGLVLVIPSSALSAARVRTPGYLLLGYCIPAVQRGRRRLFPFSGALYSLTSRSCCSSSKSNAPVIWAYYAYGYVYFAWHAVRGGLF